MINHTPPAKEPPPFAFKLELGSPAITQQAEVDAHPDTLRPAWEVQRDARAIAERIIPAMEQIANNPHLTDAGKRAESAKVAIPALKALNELWPKLDATDAVVLAQAEQLQKAAAIPEATDSDERLAEAFGRAPEQKRRRMLEHALTGKDQRMTRALARSHHSLHGLAASTQAMLQSELQNEKLDPDAAGKVRDVATKLGAVRRTVTAIASALENASDREQLKAAKVASVRRSDFATPKAKSDFIDQYGLPAWKQLPA